MGAVVKQTVMKFIVGRQLVMSRHDEGEVGGGEAEEAKEGLSHVGSARDFYMVAQQQLGSGSDYASRHLGATINEIEFQYVDLGDIQRQVGAASAPQFVKVTQQKSRGCVLVSGENVALVTEDSCACSACMSVSSPSAAPLR